MQYINGSQVSDENPIDIQVKNINLTDPSAIIIGDNINIKCDELKWSSLDSKDHFRAYADGVFSHFEFTGDDTGGLLCDFKVPSTQTPYDLRIAIGNPSGNFIQNKGLLLFQDDTGLLAGQELLIRDSSQPGGSGIALPNTTTGYVASTFNYYEEFAASLALTGLTGVATLAVQICRIGKNVTLSWNGTSIGTGTTAIITSAAMPARFRLLAPRSISIPLVNNGLNVTGAVTILTNGEIHFSSDASTVGAFTGNCAIFGGCISYNVI